MFYLDFNEIQTADYYDSSVNVYTYLSNHISLTNIQLPTQLKYLEYLNKPHIYTEPQKSASMLLAQFAEAALFQTVDTTELSNTVINTTLYDNIKNKDGYISFKSGCLALLTLLKMKNPVWNKINPEIVWFNSIAGIKHYLHRCNYLLIEMFADKAFLNTDDHSLVNEFYIQNSLGIATGKLSKGFIACGYDSDGIIVMNSLGQFVGSIGFHKIKYELFAKRFIRGCAFLNLV